MNERKLQTKKVINSTLKKLLDLKKKKKIMRKNEQRNYLQFSDFGRLKLNHNF